MKKALSELTRVELNEKQLKIMLIIVAFFCFLAVLSTLFIILKGRPVVALTPIFFCVTCGTSSGF